MTMLRHMGNLLGPRSLRELVITEYEDGKVNYQFEGMTEPVSPHAAYRLLALVADVIIKEAQRTASLADTPPTGGPTQ